MSKFYVLRDKDGGLFAGFRRDRANGMKFEAVFVKPKKGLPTQANVIHEDDLKETEQDLARYNISVDRVQVG